ncbi:g7083 [Coccomyxa elongata]
MRTYASDFKSRHGAILSVGAAACAGLAGLLLWKACRKLKAPSTKGIKVAIIGTGWGVNVQVPQFRAAGLHIFAIFSRDQKRASQIAAENRITHAFSDYSSLLSVDEVDLVSIVTPVHLHARQTIEAIMAGRNVLVDKPLCLNGDEAEQMLEAHQQRPNQVVIVDHELRFTPAFLRARQHLREGTIGAVLVVEANVLFPVRTGKFTWWADASKGGGVLGAMGSHVFDAFRFLLDAEIEEVSANLRTLVEDLPDEDGRPVKVTSDDYACLQLKLVPRASVQRGPAWASEDGHISAHATLTTRGKARMDNHLIFSGTKGAVIVNNSTGGLTVTNELGKVIDSIKGTGNPFATTGTRALGAALQRALGPEKDMSALEPAARVEDGLYVQYAIDAAKASSREDGKWIRAWNNNLEDC